MTSPPIAASDSQESTPGAAVAPAPARRKREADRIDLLRSAPFFIMHLLPLGVFWTGMTWSNAALCLALYVVRMFFITAGYHRYFAHRTYKLGRVAQFLMAFGGGTAVQKGALWWAAHHRDHHKHSDTEQDIHSPKDGFWWSQIGWILCPKYHETKYDRIKDFARYPELVWLNEHHWVPGAVLGVACYVLGGPGALFAGFFLSTALLYHGTFSINSLAHVFGRRRYETTDTSKNSFLLALITLGEGWHNNHHHFQSSANQGFFWWEVDISFYVIRFLELIGVARDVKVAPKHIVLGVAKSELRAADGGASKGAGAGDGGGAGDGNAPELSDTLSVPTPAE
jgi:stearoyl-CoA desaturase (delta-9 desaturase)